MEISEISRTVLSRPTSASWASIRPREILETLESSLIESLANLIRLSPFALDVPIIPIASHSFRPIVYHLIRLGCKCMARC